MEVGQTVDQVPLKTYTDITGKECKEKCQAIQMCNAFVISAPKLFHCEIMSLHSQDNIKENPKKTFGLKYCSGTINL